MRSIQLLLLLCFISFSALPVTISLKYTDGDHASWSDWGDAKAPIEYARDLWAAKLYSTVPIKIEIIVEDFAKKANLDDNGAAVTVADRVDPVYGFQYEIGYLYPIALYEKLDERNLNGSDCDFRVTFNRNRVWSYSTSSCISGKYDLLSTAIHEFAHGFGMNTTVRINPLNPHSIIAGKSLASGKISIFDRYVEDNVGTLLESHALSGWAFQVFILGNLYFNGNHCTAANNGFEVRLYAPSEFESGASVQHFSPYHILHSSNADKAYHPQLRPQECYRSIGTAIEGLLFDVGWDIETSIEEKEVMPHIQVFPNPCSKIVHIDIGNRIGIAVFRDINGKVVKESPLIPFESELEIENLKSGMYFVTIKNDFFTETQKITVL